MCTVTFVPVKDKVYLTSNRDEKHWRKDATPPQAHEFPHGKIWFPKDGDAGGTWLALHENGNAVVFLNGAFIKHEPKPPYRKSRGLILLDLIDSATPYNSFQVINLNGIEPFTAVIWDNDHLFECRWNGSKKSSTVLDQHKPHIWSSVTLYDESVIKRREQWFSEWLAIHPAPGQPEIIHFHLFTGDGDSHNDLRMNRQGQVYTVSVTSVLLTENLASLVYTDLKNDQSFKEDFTLDKTMASR